MPQHAAVSTDGAAGVYVKPPLSTPAASAPPAARTLATDDQETTTAAVDAGDDVRDVETSMTTATAAAADVQVHHQQPGIKHCSVGPAATRHVRSAAVTTATRSSLARLMSL